MDLEEVVRQAVRNLAFSLSRARREQLLELLPQILAQIELLRYDAEQLERYGALD